MGKGAPRFFSTPSKQKLAELEASAPAAADAPAAAAKPSGKGSDFVFASPAPVVRGSRPAASLSVKGPLRNTTALSNNKQKQAPAASPRSLSVKKQASSSSLSLHKAHNSTGNGNGSAPGTPRTPRSAAAAAKKVTTLQSAGPRIAAKENSAAEAVAAVKAAC